MLDAVQGAGRWKEGLLCDYVGVRGEGWARRGGGYMGEVDMRAGYVYIRHTLRLFAT